MLIYDPEKPVPQLEDGIYFDLPFEIYIAQERLGSSRICDLEISPATFWERSWLNKDRKDDGDTKARIIGRAYHAARFEPEKFKSDYVRALTLADFPGEDTVNTGAAIERALGAMGETKSRAGETVMDKAMRLHEAGYEGAIFPLELDQWTQGIGDKIPLDPKIYDEIKKDMERIDRLPDIAEIIRGGQSEVSYLYTDENGIKCQVRFDHLKPTLYCDFKTFDNSRRKHLNQCLTDAVRYNYYYIQIAMYWRAAEMIRSGLAVIQGDATDEQRELIEHIESNPNEMVPWIIFQEKNGTPNIVAREIKLHNLPIETQIHGAGATDEQREAHESMVRQRTQLFAKAESEILKAKKTFVAYSDIYEPGEEWLPVNRIGQIDDLDFAPYWLEERH